MNQFGGAPLRPEQRVVVFLGKWSFVVGGMGLVAGAWWYVLASVQ